MIYDFIKYISPMVLLISENILTMDEIFIPSRVSPMTLPRSSKRIPSFIMITHPHLFMFLHLD